MLKTDDVFENEVFSWTVNASTFCNQIDFVLTNKELATGICTIYLQNGNKVHYQNVSYEHVLKFVESNSKGLFYNRFIKGRWETYHDSSRME